MIGRIAYVNVFVSDLERALEFYGETLGLEPNVQDSAFGYASFAAGGVTLGLARVEPNAPNADLVGRHTGVGFAVDDLEASHRRLSGRGVEFTQPPEKQPWGGFMALFRDPDGNVYYLDQVDRA